MALISYTIFFCFFILIAICCSVVTCYLIDKLPALFLIRHIVIGALWFLVLMFSSYVLVSYSDYFV